jgi:hypothetical protein
LLDGDNEAHAAGSMVLQVACGFFDASTGDSRVFSSFRLTPKIGLRADDARRIGP